MNWNLWRVKRVLTIALLFAVVGCGKNYVVREEARSFAVEGEKSVARYKEFYTTVVQADHDFEMARRIVYPGCPLNGKYYLSGLIGVAEALDQHEDRAEKDGRPLPKDRTLLASADCRSYRQALAVYVPDDRPRQVSRKQLVAAETRRTEELGDHCLNLSGALQCAKILPPSMYKKAVEEVSPTPLSPDLFSTELSLLIPLGSYLDALKTLAKDPTSDVRSDIDDALNRLDKVASRLQRDSVSAEAKDKAEKAGNLISLLHKLYKEEKQVEKIRKLINVDGVRIEAIISELATAADHDYSQIYKTGVISRTTLYQNALELRPEAGDVGGRILLMNNYSEALAVEAGVLKWKKLHPEASPAGEAMRAVAVAHRELRQVLAGDLNEEQRREATRQSWRNFKDSLRAIDDVIDVFGGL